MEGLGSSPVEEAQSTSRAAEPKVVSLSGNLKQRTNSSINLTGIFVNKEAVFREMASNDSNMEVLKLKSKALKESWKSDSVLTGGKVQMKNGSGTIVIKMIIKEEEEVPDTTFTFSRFFACMGAYEFLMSHTKVRTALGARITFEDFPENSQDYEERIPQLFVPGSHYVPKLIKNLQKMMKEDKKNKTEKVKLSKEVLDSLKDDNLYPVACAAVICLDYQNFMKEGPDEHVTGTEFLKYCMEGRILKHDGLNGLIRNAGDSFFQDMNDGQKSLFSGIVRSVVYIKTSALTGRIKSALDGFDA